MTVTRRTKTVGVSDTVAKAVMGAAALVIGGLVYAVFQLAHRMQTDEWLPGGANPLNVAIAAIKAREPVGMWHGVFGAAALTLLLGAVFLTATLVRRHRSRHPDIDKAAKYLGKGEVFTAKAVEEHARKAGLTTGEQTSLAVAKVVRTDQWFHVGFRDNLTEIMGPGSGKTTGSVVPLALDAPGAVWATSNKPELAALLGTSRDDKGKCWIFDPQRVAEEPPRFYYDPLSYIRARPEEADTRAAKMASQFAESGRPLDTKTDAYFEPASTTLVGNFLLAAALENLPITQVLQWTSLPKNTRALDILRDHGQHDSADQVEGVQSLAHQTQSSIYQGAANQLRFLKNQAARAWVQRTGPDDDRPEFDPRAFVRSRDTFICLSREGIASFGPLIAAMTAAMIEAAEEYATSCGGRLPIPLLALLDEVANVCRIKELPDLMSHAGGRGILIVPILQSPGQGRDAWGPGGWDKLWGATTVRIIGRGLIDIEFLRGISEASGDLDLRRPTTNVSHGHHGGSTSRSHNWTTERILSVADLVAMPAWRSLVVPAGDRPTLLELVPYFDRPEMKARVDASKAAFQAAHPHILLVDEAAEVENFRPVTVAA